LARVAQVLSDELHDRAARTFQFDLSGIGAALGAPHSGAGYP